jgi:hypothetical protein
MEQLPASSDASATDILLVGQMRDNHLGCNSSAVWHFFHYSFKGRNENGGQPGFA